MSRILRFNLTSNKSIDSVYLRIALILFLKEEQFAQGLLIISEHVISMNSRIMEFVPESFWDYTQTRSLPCSYVRLTYSKGIWTRFSLHLKWME